MALELPSTLSPSKVSTFTDCALAFRFSAVERLPEPPSAPAVKGTLVHRALELLLDQPPERRDVAEGLRCLGRAVEDLEASGELAALELGEEGEAAFLDHAEALLRRYFEMEDPTTIRPIGLELLLEARLGDLRLRGIIDRLELDADGELVVTDYKTGRVPHQNQERSRLGGVHFYAYLCEQVLGRRPAVVQLLYLSDGVTIRTNPTEQSTRAVARKAGAIWSAVERACATENFQPRRSRLCDWCSFRAYCPAWGGEPAPARADLELLGRLRAPDELAA